MMPSFLAFCETVSHPDIDPCLTECLNVSDPVTGMLHYLSV